MKFGLAYRPVAFPWEKHRPIASLTRLQSAEKCGWLVFNAPDSLRSSGRVGRIDGMSDSGFEFVYVNQDGSVRELSPAEQAYLSEEFSGGDSGRPYIKSSYKSRDGWGSMSGFITRRSVPAGITILPVHPDYDAREKELGFDMLGSFRAAGDIIQTNADGSVSCTPNPKVSRDERIELSRRWHLEDQRKREMLALVPDAKSNDS